MALVDEQFAFELVYLQELHEDLGVEGVSLCDVDEVVFEYLLLLLAVLHHVFVFCETLIVSDEDLWRVGE